LSPSSKRTKRGGEEEEGEGRKKKKISLAHQLSELLSHPSLSHVSLSPFPTVSRAHLPSQYPGSKKIVVFASQLEAREGKKEGCAALRGSHWMKETSAFANEMAANSLRR
jgi:hypothetical protein